MPEDAAAVAADVPGSGGDAAGQALMQSDTGMASARLHAIAKLRRAASQREVRHATPRTAPPAEPVPQKEESRTPQKETPAADAPTEAPPAALLPSPLPSLEQLRQRLLRERKPTGLSRSASASATSQVARAYTMQKLLGSTTPLPYQDIFAFVRGVNQASVTSDTPSTPPRNEAATEVSPKRATLLRSVSARDGARIRRVRRIGRQDASSDTLPAASPEATPPRAPVSASTFSDDSSSNTAHDSTGSSGWRVSLYYYDSSPSSRQTSVGTTAPVGPGAMPRASDSFQGTGATGAAPQHDAPRPSLELHTPLPTGLAPVAAAPEDVRRTPCAAPVLTEAHEAMEWRTTERGSLKSPPLYRQSPPKTRAHTPAPSPDTSPVGVSVSPHAVWQKKPLPRLPPVPSARVPRDSVSGDTLPLAPRPNATPTHPFPDMLAPMLARSASLGTGRRTPRDDDDERKEARVARLWGSLRRKTSMRALRRPSGHSSPAASTATSGDSAWATVALLTEAEAPLHEPVVTLPVTPAMLMQWNQTLDRPVRHLLSYLPAEVPCDIALDPPRRLVCVLPLLQAAGDEFVKLRYAFVFQDVLVLAKPPLIVHGDESVPDVMLRKLSQAPALSEPCVPFAVLDLAQVQMQLQRHGELNGSELRPFNAPHLATPHARLDSMLVPLAREMGLLPGESDAATHAATQAHLPYLWEPLDRTVLWRFLQERPQMLAPFVAQYRVRGVPLDVALRQLLLDLPRPESASSMEALLLAFASHWHASNAAEWPAHTLESVTDLTWAIVALNDALHQPDGHWAVYGPSLSLSDFTMGFRTHGASHAVSDRELGEIYLSVHTSPLVLGGSDADRRTISIDAHAWYELGALGVPSAPVRVCIDAPDPDLQVHLVGPGLLVDPPVLTFAHSAHAQFTLCAATPGPHDLIFVRMGRHARFYGGHAPAHGMAVLPRSVQVRAGREAPTPRTTLSLVSTVSGTTHTFYLTDTPSAQRVTALLQSTIEAARAHALRLCPAEWDVRALCRRVLEASLLPSDDASCTRRSPPPATGQALVQTTRDNSLLMHVLRPA